MKKTVLVTGASRGIGKAAALAFSRKGYDLIITCREDKEALSETASAIRELKKGYCRAFAGNLGNPDDVRRLFGEIAVTFGGADIVVNNAGISYTGLITDMTDEQWNEIVACDLSSVFYCSRAAVPYMVRQKEGRIINVSSIWGDNGGSCEVAYSAVKSGVNGLTRALAKELAPSGIQVNAAAFGAIDTTMNARLSPEERSALEEEIPMGRFGSPEEAARLIVGLAEAPDYMTGQIVTMDGGWLV